MPAAQGAIDSSKLGSSTSPLEGTWTNDHHRLGSHVVGAAQIQRSGSNETPSWVVRHDIKGSRSDATTAQSDPSRAFAANMSYQSGNAMESAHDPSRSDQNVGSIASGTSTNVYTDSTLHYQLNSPSATSCVIDMSSPTGGIGGVLSHQVSQDNQRYGSTIQSHTRKTTTQLPLSTYRGHLSDYKVDLSTQPSPDADSSPKETSRLLRPHDADLEGSCDKATTLIDPAALTPSRNDLTVAAVHDILDTLIPDMELCITTQGCLAIWREARVFLCMFPCVCFRFVVVQLILDTELIFVGHLGVPQLAGVGLVRFWVAIPFGFLYCSMRAVYVLGSMTRGNRPSAAGHWLQTALGFALVGTLAVSYYYVHVADLAHLAALDDVAISYAREFAPIVLLGLFPSLAMAAIDNFMRIQDIALPALVCATVACVLNIYLHFVFIYGAFGWSGWGFVGSPWATVTSLVTQVALYVAYTVLWKRYHVPYWSGWAWNSHRLHRYRLFWRVSVPLGGMVVVFSIACLIVGTIASYSPSPFTAPHRQLDDGGAGSERVGAWVISFCLFLLVLAVLLGVAEATKVRMLVYLTHGWPKLARQVLYVGLAYSALFALVFASALFMYKSVVFRIWTNDAGILEQCVDVVRWIMLCLVLASVRVVLASGLIVLKKRPMVLLAQCIDVWCVQVPGSFVLPLLLQFQHLSGFWIAVAMGECVHVLLLVYALCQVNGDDDQALVKSVQAAVTLVNQTSSPFKAKHNERENADNDIDLGDLTKPLTLSHVVTDNALCDAPPTVQFVVTADVAIDVLTGSLSDHNHTSVCGADAPQLHVETRSTNECTLSHELATAFHEDGSSDDSNALKAGVSSVHSGHTKAGSTDGDTGITDTERDKHSSLLHIPVSTSLRGVGTDNPSTLATVALDGSPFPQVKHARSSAVPPRIYSTAAHAVECEAHSLGEAAPALFAPPKIVAQKSLPPRSETIELPPTENEVAAKSSSPSHLNNANVDDACAPPRLHLRDISTPEIPPELSTLPRNANDLAPPKCLYRTLTPLKNPTKLGDLVLESNRQIKTHLPDAVCTLFRPQDQAAASATFNSSIVDDDDVRSAVPLVEVHVAGAQKLVPEDINVLEQIEVKLPLDNHSSTDVILLKPIRSVQAEVALLNETTSPQPPSDAGSDSSNDGTTGQVSESESGASSTSQRRRPKAAVPPSVKIETLGGVDISTLHFGKRSKKRRTREAKQSKRVSFSPSPRQRRPSAYGIQPSLD
ncbi:hypothetical protein H257_00816 [Aphanomyces astaci]|uniref:Transmembrane protein n=1 Tax=Aphanomyces astaci TaxID=112090 RepID=W4HC96_APHAT|nr:hypothetical protein H257_00816 [Aphanomyces astaci]ETV89605.1 hypothetical protein H257_00816 [Aphanomyces astaci]|eukprot:XP_009822005.1 hypothetical protein H257_00816 [Aphanomyces astaci]